MTDFISKKSEHEVQISKRKAIELVGASPLPVEGQERVIAVTRGKQKLVLTNVAGQYRLSCDTSPREHWGLMFGVSIPDSECL
jgi:hypothetical protein